MEAFEWIYPYSPVHNVRRPIGGTRQYPAMLLTTGTLFSGSIDTRCEIYLLHEVQGMSVLTNRWQLVWHGCAAASGGQ